MNKGDMKEEIRQRELLVREAEKQIGELQQRIVNNKKWIAELRQELKSEVEK